MSADDAKSSNSKAETGSRPGPQPNPTIAAGRKVGATELVWPRKYDEHGRAAEPPRISLPFQVIEVIEQGRASREALAQGMLPLFGARPRGPEEDGWRNKLIWGDNLLVLGSLLRDFAGAIDLIYIDPPFATGADFSFSAKIGDGGAEAVYAPSTLELKAYRDIWNGGTDTYLPWLYDRLVLARDLLSAKGSILIHCDHRLSHIVGLLCDELFGPGDRSERRDTAGFRNEIVWMYGLGGSSPKCYPKKHDVILWYSRGSDWIFDPPMVPATSNRMKGQLKKCPDTWDIPSINNMAAERTGYPTQKPEKLLDRIVKAHSTLNSIVLDFFCGSGTTLVAAEKLGRRWIGCDLSRFALHVTRKRLLSLVDGESRRGCKPFEVLNLGRYERKYWQGITFGNGDIREPDQAALAAYVRFVLDLYNAQPLPGQHIHAKKGSGLVHVGAVDAPVTISQVEQALEEAKGRGAHELHVLGWEWEMGLHDPLLKMAKTQYGVTLRLLNIPREVMDRRATEAGKVQFFNLAYLEVELKGGSGAKGSRCVKAKLKDFVIPNTDLIPEAARKKVRKWSDYIDYWAVDWDFRDDTFINQWQTYRTPKNRKLALESAEHTYDSPGTYRVLVKVVDIFGNDTSHLLSWEAK